MDPVLTVDDFRRAGDGEQPPLLSGIQVAMGAASMCWDDAGVFQSERAAQIAADLDAWIRLDFGPVRVGKAEVGVQPTHAAH